ncbi:MAG: MFS transporter, partial [Chloroflexi bacterium]|nr:MFS transporter [Chloroflexota bacterium]
MENETLRNETHHAVAAGGSMATPPRVPPRPAGLSRTFAALRHPNYRLYFSGQLISLIGTWMQNVAQGWLAYQLTGSPLYLGLVGFAASIPVLFLSLGAGVLVDRFPRRYVLLATQTWAMLLAFVLSALVFTNLVQPWHIVVLAFLLGISQAFDGTARQAFVKDMVGKEDMMNAIALNSALFNISRIIGPALAGLTLAVVGAGLCFFLNGLSFIAVIFGILAMQMPKFVAPQRKGSILVEI